MSCADCGDPSESALCPPCADVAAALGHTIPDRLTMLGALF